MTQIRNNVSSMNSQGMEYVKNLEDLLVQKPSELALQIEIQVYKNQEEKRRKFVFTPNLTLDDQIIEDQSMDSQILEFQVTQFVIFKKLLINQQWNGQIQFKNYKGTFKLEYWGNFEEILRKAIGIKKFSFLNTQFSKQHLTLLKSLIQWVSPEEISLKFKWNEIDDEDLEEFLIQGLLPTVGRKMKTFKVVSNPGTFKGHFLRHLQRALDEMSKFDPLFSFHFIKDKEYKSFGFIRMPRVEDQEGSVKDPEILKFERSLQQTCYYQLSLRSCFNKDNQKAFEHLIEYTYDVDKLEQLQSLDVGECHLGLESTFVKMSRKISTSKGLLSLGLSGQKHIHNSQVLQPLMGDRYDRIRIDHIDIGNNQNLHEAAMKLLANNLISKSLKTINIHGSVNKDQNLFAKIACLTEAFFNQIKGMKKIIKKEKRIPRLKLKKLDLSQIDGLTYSPEYLQLREKQLLEAKKGKYDRPDLTKELLLSMVLNEHSSVKQLTLQSLDVERLEAHLKALDEFEDHMDTMKKNNNLYLNFEPKLISIEMHLQDYQIDQHQYVLLIQRFFFTRVIDREKKSTDLLQINSIAFRECFFLKDREKGFIEFLKTLNNNSLDIQYTLKNLTIENNGGSRELFVLLFKNVVFSRNFKLNSLTMKNEKTTDKDWRDFLVFCENFQNQVTSQGELFQRQLNYQTESNFKIICFENLGGNLDVLKFVELMVFNQYSQLEELVLININVKKNDDSMKSLKNIAKTWDKPQTLKKLHLGKLSVENDLVLACILEVLMIHPMSSVSELLLQLGKIQNFKGTLEILQNRIQSNQQSDEVILQLTTLIQEDYIEDDCTQEQWDLFTNVFINEDPKSQISESLFQSKEIKNFIGVLEILQTKILSHQESDKVMIQFKNLILKNCIEDNFTQEQQKLFDEILQSENVQNFKGVLQALRTKILLYYQQRNKVMGQLKTLILEGCLEDNCTQEQWELFADVFIYGGNINLKNLQIKHLTISEDLSKGFKNSYSKKKKYLKDMKKPEFCNSLQTLIFSDCTFEDEIFSLLFVAQIEIIKTLHIVQCKNLELSIQKFREVYGVSQEQFSHVEFSLKELILDHSEISSSDLFQWFFRNIILNEKTQQLQYLSMKDCNLQDSHLTIINNILREIKDQKSDNKKSHFKLRNFNFDGQQNPNITSPRDDEIQSQQKCITESNWSNLFDILFSVKDIYKDQQKIDATDFVDPQIMILNNEESKKKRDLQEKNRICDQLTKDLVDNRLLIPKNLISYPERYNISAPTQIQCLELDISFKNEIQETKQRLYSRILKGLAFFSETKLQVLSLTQVDLPLFIQSSKECFYSFNQSKKIPLEHLELRQIQNQTKDSISKLAELYLSRLEINLVSLVVMIDVEKGQKEGNFLVNIYEAIEIGLQQNKSFKLKILKLNIYSNLDFKQSLIFFETVVLNKQVPLSSLEIGDLISLDPQKTFLQKMSTHFKQQYKQNPCPLKEVSIIIQGVMFTSKNLVKNIIPLFITGNLVKLDKFSVLDKNQPSIPLAFFEELCDFKNLINFSIQDLSLNIFHCMSLEDFKFLFIIRPKLKFLQIKLSTPIFEDPEKFDDFLELNQVSRGHLQQEQEANDLQQSQSDLIEINQGSQIKKKLFFENCKLKLQFSDLQLTIKPDDITSNQNKSDLIKQFVFGQDFKWSNTYIEVCSLKSDSMSLGKNLILNKKSLFDDFFKSKGEVKLYLRHLEINMQLLGISSLQLPDDCLKLIGEQLIYDTNSILEELSLISCDLEVHSLQALTSRAQEFRDKIQKSKQQQKTNLALKRFSISHSQSIYDEGGYILNGNIFFFEYITIERIKVDDTGWNSAMMQSQCQYAKNWLEFQVNHQRNKPQLSIKHIDWGNNELVETQKAWFSLCDTFLFSNMAPFIESVNMQQMGLKDQQIYWLCEKADDYFRYKSSSFKHPLKRLNFMKNINLSAEGWQVISESFFFSQHVELQELNLKQTQLDSQEKLDAIIQAGIFRASKRSTKKLQMHTLLTNNITLKQCLGEIMTEKSDIPLYDQQQRIQNQDHTQINLQNIEDETPDSFGLTTSIITRNIYGSKVLKLEQWRDQYQVRFSEYHIDIVQGFLGLLKQYFNNPINEKCFGHFPIDMTTCDELCTIFKYNQIQGDPYPYQLFFTPEACKFYTQPSCNIRVINFIQTDYKNNEQMDQFKVFNLWKLLNSTNTSIDVVYVDYSLDDDLVDLMLSSGFNERDLVNLVRLFPPSSIRLQDTLTLQALKGICSIMYDNYQFEYANILFDKDIFLNVGIGYSLRELVYRTNPTGYIGISCKRISYKFFNLFVDVVSKYSFSEQIRELNEFLCNQTEYFFILTLLTFIFYVVCLFGPYGWQHYSQKEKSMVQVCYDGISPQGLYCYLVFAFLTFLDEAYLYYRVSLIIPNHIKGLVNTDKQNKGVEIDEQPEMNGIGVFQTSEKPPARRGIFAVKPLLHDEEKSNLIQKLHKDNSKPKNQNKPNKVQALDIIPHQGVLKNLQSTLQNDVARFAKSRSGRILGYTKDLALGQVAKFSLYTDVSFITLTYYCQFNTVALLALISTGFNVYFQLYNLFNFIWKQCFSDKNKAKNISTKYINDFYEISTIGRNVALSTILDTVAPFNVTVISNNFITRALVPKLAGKSMSNSVRVIMIFYKKRVMFSNLPLVTYLILFYSFIMLLMSLFTLTLIPKTLIKLQ